MYIVESSGLLFFRVEKEKAQAAENAKVSLLKYNGMKRSHTFEWSCIIPSFSSETGEIRIYL